MRLNVNKAAADPAVKAKSAIAEHLNTNAATFVSKSASDGIASLESLSYDAQENVQTAFADVADSVKEQLLSAGIEDINDTQLTAAAIAAMAAGNPAGYARQALSGVPGEVAGGRMIHAAGADYRDSVNPSLEAFDERALRDSLPTSISPVDFFGFLNHFRRVVDTAQGGEFALKVSVEKWDNNTRRFEAKPDGKIVVSRTDDGVWHIALISWDNSRPMIRFPLTLSKKAQLVNAQGESMPEAEVSRAVALGLIEVLYELIPHLLQQNYEPPKPRENGGQQGGGGRSGQGGYNRGGGGGGYQNRDNGGGGGGGGNYGGYGNNGGGGNSGGGHSQPPQNNSNDWSGDSLPM